MSPVRSVENTDGESSGAPFGAAVDQDLEDAGSVFEDEVTGAVDNDGLALAPELADHVLEELTIVV